MPVTSFASPARLTWLNFARSPSRMRDHHDGSLVDSVVEIDWSLAPNLPPKRAGSHFVMDDSMMLLITPKCRVWTGVVQTATLLSHEQFHYDVAIVIARVLARKLNSLRASSDAAFRPTLATAVRLHFVTRNNLIQRRYDRDTQHTTNASGKIAWSRAWPTSEQLRLVDSICESHPNPQTAADRRIRETEKSDGSAVAVADQALVAGFPLLNHTETENSKIGSLSLS